MTFSVPARDPDTGDMGMAVASCILAARGAERPVGSRHRDRAGAQPPRAGPQRAHRAGHGAAPRRPVRRAAHAAEDADQQIAVLDASRGIAANTEQGSFPVNGHPLGDRSSVQGNMLASADVLPAIAAAYA